MISRLSDLVLVPLVATSIFAAIETGARPRGQAQPTALAEQKVNSTSQELADAAALDEEIVKLYDQAKFDEAIPLAKRVLKTREKLLPANDPLLAFSASNLAALYVAKMKFGDAEPLFKRALTIYEEKPEGKAFHLAKTLDSLGTVRLFKSDVKRAEEFYLRALSIKEKVFNVDHEEILSSRINLAELYARQREYAKATAMLRRVIFIKEQKLGKSDTQVGRLLERMACLLYRNNETTEAEKVEARANHILYSDLAIKPEPIWLPNEVFSCKLINNPRPDFISVARTLRFKGSTKMDVAVETDEAGNVKAARFTSGDPAFKSVAEKAALKAKLRPTIVDGRAMKVEGVISHQFMTTTRTVMIAVPGNVIGGP